MSREVEEPCEKTGKRCRWIWCDDLCGDLHCQDCYRFRDFSLEDYPEPEEAQP